MTLALGTLIFLCVGWAAASAVLALLDDNGRKIVLALRGDSLLAREPAPVRTVTVRFSPRYPQTKPQPLPVQALRAAA